MYCACTADGQHVVPCIILILILNTKREKALGVNQRPWRGHHVMVNVGRERRHTAIPKWQRESQIQRTQQHRALRPPVCTMHRALRPPVCTMLIGTLQPPFSPSLLTTHPFIPTRNDLGLMATVQRTRVSRWNAARTSTETKHT